MQARELRIRNLVTDEFYDSFKTILTVESISEYGINLNIMSDGNYPECSENWIEPDYSFDKLFPIPLTEEWLLRFGFTVINENSAGKRYGYVIDGVFSSDLTFTFWKTTKQEGKFFRGDLELKSVNQFQNLIFALTGTELELKQL